MKVLIFLLSLGLLVGCGSQKPLTPEQKAKFTETLDSVGRIQEAVKLAQEKGPNIAPTDAKSRMARKLCVESVQPMPECFRPDLFSRFGDINKKL
jgi:hypothetical protein